MLSKEIFVARKDIKIRDNEDYITLNVLLKLGGLIDTGGMAKAFLANNDVYVNGEPENRRGRKLYRGDEIHVLNQTFLIK